MLDDGVGPRVAQELEARYGLPANVEVMERGTMGMALISDLRAVDRVLVVDGVDGTGQQPGTVVRYSPRDIAPYESFHGAHDCRFVDVLDALLLLGHEVQGSCVGVQVLNASPAEAHIGLTGPVEGALPLLIHTVLMELRALGCRVMDKGTGAPWDAEEEIVL
jgi:hydrogenase maturation protease